MEKKLKDPEKDFLYLQITERIENQIKNKNLKTGDRLLSVRALSKEQGISLSTAYKAYIELENKGLIEARPKSGYYVRYTQLNFPKKPDPSEPKREMENISVDEMISIVYKNLSDEEVVWLSLSGPTKEILPEAKLNKSMAEALRKSPSSCMGYEDVEGNLMLRMQIAKNAFSWGGNFTANEIITTHGCMEALVFCLKAVTVPGDTVAIESPTYFGIFNVMKCLGLKVLEIPTDNETGINLKYLKKAVEKIEVTACLFTPNFNNPTGSCMPDKNKKYLVELLASKNIPLIEDDIYGDMYFGKNRPKTCKSFDRTNNVMLCSSVSKTLAPGYRVGWCIPGRYKSKILMLKLMHIVSSHLQHKLL